MNLLTNARDTLNERYPKYDPDKIIAVTVRSFKRAGTGFEQQLKTTVQAYPMKSENDCSTLSTPRKNRC